MPPELVAASKGLREVGLGRTNRHNGVCRLPILDIIGILGGLQSMYGTFIRRLLASYFKF
uniref:Uncharacterized protein n=1 Tax=Hyaloperonospora arabidopsidis (strain Emoy2) TaxID=559515 RepID=M4BPH7_HYAAE